MKARVEAVWAIKTPPDDEAEGLHEFSLYWYRFSQDPQEVDPAFRTPARPAVWVKFGRLEHLERIQSGYPEATLGPVSSYNEALIFTENWEEAQALQKKVAAFLEEEEEDDDGMGEILKEDTMEDL
jgi:hypothetical protein